MPDRNFLRHERTYHTEPDYTCDICHEQNGVMRHGKRVCEDCLEDMIDYYEGLEEEF